MGLAMENFDAVGQWRTDGSRQPDRHAGRHHGRHPHRRHPGACATCCVRDGEMFAQVVIEKLLTYAIGRGLEHDDMPLVRSMRAAAAKDELSVLVLLMGVVQSPAFTMNVKAGAAKRHSSMRSSSHVHHQEAHQPAHVAARRRRDARAPAARRDDPGGDGAGADGGRSAAAVLRRLRAARRGAGATGSREGRRAAASCRSSGSRSSRTAST
jgi:hypothetical protein